MNEEPAKWERLIANYDAKRRNMLITKHDFKTDDFSGDFEYAIGMDFSIPFMFSVFPRPMLEWPLEKQAELANVEVRANTVHRRDWTFPATQTYWTLLVTILVQLATLEIDPDGIANLAYHVMYSPNAGHRRRAWILYRFDRSLCSLLCVDKLVKGLATSGIVWILFTFFMADPTQWWYWTGMVLLFAIFVSFLWYLAIVLGKQKSQIHQVIWKEMKVENSSTDIDAKNLDVWDARMLLVRKNE
jgi:hypothetical protein